MTEERLREIEKLLEKVVAGPWKTGGHDGYSERSVLTAMNVQLLGVDGAATNLSEDEAIAAFVAASRTAVPELVAAVRAAQDWAARLSHDRAQETGLYEAGATAERAWWVRAIDEIATDVETTTGYTNEIRASVSIALRALFLSRKGFDEPFPWDQVRAEHARMRQALTAIRDLCQKAATLTLTERIADIVKEALGDA